MSNKNDYVIVAGKKVSTQAYEFLLSRFKEAFSHTSLSVERAFEELEKYNITLETSVDRAAYDYYCLLSHSEKKKIQAILHQIMVFKASRYGVITEELTGDPKQFEKLYHEYLEYYEDYLYFYLKFDQNGDFDKVSTLHCLDTLFVTLPQRRRAYLAAYNMKKDNLNAFDYAISLDEITVPEVIKINSIVNYSDDDKVDGYKTTNNDILTSSFTPVDKRFVPTEMQKLFEDYRNDFDLELLDPNEENITTEERLRRRYKLFEKEAIFHIRFERIHPFNDGNGRTGRIILNAHLLKNNQAPVLITDVMSDDYKKCINSFDVDGLTKLLMMSSSQQLTNWVSLYKSGLYVKKKDIRPDNSKLAELEEFADDSKKYSKKKNDDLK